MFRLLYRLPWLLLHILIGTPVTLFFFLPGIRNWSPAGRPVYEHMTFWWSAMVCRIFGVHRKVAGKVPKGAALLAANHIATLDIPLIHSVVPAGFVAKAEIANWPVLGLLARAGGTVFHQRGSHDSASGVGAQMAARLNSGRPIGIFPEGGIFPPIRPKHFHARLFGPAIETRQQVVPVMLRYVRNGKILDDVTFLPGEHFVANFFRLLSQPAYVAELSMLEAIDPSGLERKQLAAQAESAVRTAYETPVT